MDQALQECAIAQQSLETIKGQLREKSLELQKVNTQTGLKKKHNASALRRVENELEGVRTQLQEALREGNMTRADAVFARLPFSIPACADREDSGGIVHREDVLNEENGELRALLAGICLRLRELVPEVSYQISDPTSIFELPTSLILSAVREDMEAALNRIPNIQ